MAHTCALGFFSVLAAVLWQRAHSKSDFGNAHSAQSLLQSDWRHGPAQAVLLQQGTSHLRRQWHPDDPQMIEDMDTIFGVPKIVWVILSDVIAMGIFLFCIPVMMYLSKWKKDEEPEPFTCC
mmetsp:Transcript_121736/g.191043  ORF Transcript_121736/g.191043 Transcript_121736/m.191043 type:complete len:122 (-) Transcript_121736:120-485(-)